ncbi:sigma-70 family RNA polymerase sigma factor [soil metagenome]
MFLRKSSSEKSDEELLRLYKSTSDLIWLSTLYLKYAPMVYGVCLKYLKNREESKDAVMQVHEKLIETLLRHEVSNFKSWLYVIARNHCLMQIRAKKGKITEEISPFLIETGVTEHPEEELDMELNVSKLEKCIKTLVSAQQLCVRLFFLQEKCYKEIVEETSFDLKQVKSYIQNGKRNLKICMEQNGQ